MTAAMEARGYCAPCISVRGDNLLSVMVTVFYDHPEVTPTGIYASGAVLALYEELTGQMASAVTLFKGVRLYLDETMGRDEMRFLYPGGSVWIRGIS